MLCDQLNIRHRLHQSKEHLEKFSLKVSKKSRYELLSRNYNMYYGCTLIECINFYYIKI